MYILHKETIAAGLYGKPQLIGSDSMLKLQSRALKAAAALVALNPTQLEYDRKRKHGVITITVRRKYHKSMLIATWFVRKLVIV